MVAPFIPMLRTIGVEFLVKDPRSINKNSIIDGVGNNSKVDRVKSWANFWAELAKFKNMV